LSSLCFSVPHHEHPIWYAAGNVLSLGKKYRSSTFPKKIVLRLYNEIVDIDWYISKHFIEDLKSTDDGTCTCIIRNAFGSFNLDIDTRETTLIKHVLILQHEIKYCLANNDAMHRVCSYINTICATSGAGTA
jgi:hypothetical protein